MYTNSFVKGYTCCMTSKSPRRVHTGRRRNDAARRAILDSAAHLLAGTQGAAVGVDAIADAAGVSKRTIYRWWPSRGAVLLEAMVDRAKELAPASDTGSLVGDLRAFLTATFRSARRPENAALLRNAMAEALRDAAAAQALHAFTADRRTVLRGILGRARERGELAADADLDLTVDQAYGVLWYRLLIGHGALTSQAAVKLAGALARQVSRR
jgi:AcrR family transcriptional regulator